MNSTPPKVIYMVIGIVGVIAFTSVASLCLTLFYKNYADPAVLTAIISIGSSALGSLGTMLVNTRSQPPSGTMTSTITTTTKPTSPDKPAEVIVTNTPDAPVPTVEAQT